MEHSNKYRNKTLEQIITDRKTADKFSLTKLHDGILLMGNIPGLTMQDTRSMIAAPKTSSFVYEVDDADFSFGFSKNKNRLGAIMPAAARNKVPVISSPAKRVGATAGDTSKGYTTNSDIFNVLTPARIKLYIEFEFDINKLAISKFIAALESCAPGSKAVIRHVEEA